MNEYNEAIQRLEIQERIPGTDISRFIFPLPRKDTPRHFDYIFRTTGNTNIPKYSIPMNCIINNAEYHTNDPNDANDRATGWYPIEQKNTFTFELDPTFLTTQGYRKSIAVRKNRMLSVIYQGTNSYISKVSFVCSSINPWSQKNIIGNPMEEFQAMPRVFPWNGEKHIDIWFLDENGQILHNPIVKGYIELELIIDNENTYALDE